MNIEQLKDIARKGQLTLQVYERPATRVRYVWSKEPDILDQRIVGTKTENYTRRQYHARCEWQASHESYKIRKADYKELEAIINSQI